MYIYTSGTVIKGSLVRKVPSYGRWSWFAFPASCQPHHHVNPIITSTRSSCQPPIIKQLGSVTVRKRVNSRVRTFSGAKPCVFSGNVAPGVAKALGGSLFPRVRGSIWESCRQRVRRTSARARFANVEKSACSEHFWKMRTAKCARDCSESSICTSRSKKLRGSEHFWRMRLAKYFFDSLIHWFLGSNC